MPTPVLLEREALLEELLAALREVARSGGLLVLLSGSAGVGKTALTRALGARAASGVRQLRGDCDALSTPEALGPLLDMSEQAPALARAARGTRHELFSAFLRELRGRQTLVVIEDVHWADAATADLLTHLARRVASTSALVVVTYRSDELAPHHPVRIAIDGMASERRVMRREVQPLSVEGVATLARGRPIDVAQLHARTGGNPFFVTEVLAAPGWAVPPTVADAVRARARRLPPGAGEAVRSMSVETGAVRLEQLRALGHADDDVDAAVASGMLVVDGPRIAFRHELARLGVLGELAPAERAALHRAWLRLLTTLEPGDADAARLAAHAVGADDRPGIVHWSRIAATHAVARGTHREAAAHLEAALEATPGADAAQRAELLTSLARALGHLDRRADAVRVCVQALALQRELGDRPAALVVQVELARAWWGLGDGPRAQEAIAAAVAEAQRLRRERAAGAERAIAHALAWAAYLAMLARDHPAATRLARAAVRIARTHGFDDLLAVALNALGSTLIVGARDLAGVRALEESRALAAALGRENQVADALVNLGTALGEIREPLLAARWLEECIDFTAARDLDAARHYATAWLARVRLDQGRWAEATALAAGLDLDDGASPVSAIVALTVQGLVRVRRGEAVGLELDEAWRLSLRTDDLQRLWPVAAARAELAWATGRGRDVARDDAAAVGDRAAALGVTWARDELAHWAARLGGPAPTVTEPTTPFALQALGRWAEAAAAWDALGCRFEHASALAELGDERALRDALAILQELGAAPMAARVRRRLRDLGATSVPLGPRGSVAAHPSGLTGRQLAVLELVAAGLSDRQIGERLSLSPKTVGHHVSAILATLAVGGRTAAARIAVERGWLSRMGSLPQESGSLAP